MFFLNHIAVFLVLILSSLLLSVYSSFKDFTRQSRSVFDMDIASLASSNYVAKQTNNYLYKLQQKLLERMTDFEQYRVGRSPDKTQESLARELKNDYLNFLQSLSLDEAGDLKQTFYYGFEKQASFENSNISLIHSDYLPGKLQASDQNYASTLVEDSQQEKLELDDLSSFTDSGKLKISLALLEILVGQEYSQDIRNNDNFFGLWISDSGLDYSLLPNGIAVKTELTNNL